MEGSEAVSIRLAQELAAFRLRRVPAHVIGRAKLLLLDTLGAMLAASSPKYSATRILVEFVRGLGGRPESSLLGQRMKTSCVNAALVNGTLGYSCDIEPHHVGGILHAPAVVVPASLAVAGIERLEDVRGLAALLRVLAAPRATPASARPGAGSGAIPRRGAHR